MTMTLTGEELAPLLEAFGVTEPLMESSVLLTRVCAPEKMCEEEFRLILRLDFASRPSLVLKLRGGEGLRNTPVAIASQCRFADTLHRCGFPTPAYLRCGADSFTLACTLRGYALTATVEEYAGKELTQVDASIAFQTGLQLAVMHNIAEQEDCHCIGEVIFDFFSPNDLFAMEDLEELLPRLPEKARSRAEGLLREGRRRMDELAPLSKRPRYAVQGDISDCNSYLTPDGALGFFDFNCGGDNILFCDAVMQGWFEAHLMTYAGPRSEALAHTLFESFARGYHEQRPFSEEERRVIPVMYALITAFDAGRIWRELSAPLEKDENADVSAALDAMAADLSARIALELDK